MFAFGQKTFVILNDRGIVRVNGPDARAFLQGLITNDIEKAALGRVIYAALLTPQGKYLFDFFIVTLVDASGAESLYLDCERLRAADLIARLSAYKLRSRIAIANATDDFRVIALLGDGPHDSEALRGFEGRGGPFAGGLCYVDPRYAGIGARALLPASGLGELMEAGFVEAEPERYERLRLYYGLPDGSRDLAVEKSPMLESGFGDLNAIDWNKGCYVGQELTARTRYRGLVKKRLLPVEIEGALPPFGAPVRDGSSAIGEMRTSFDGYGIALLRMDELDRAMAEGRKPVAEEATLTILRPGWFKAEETAEPAPAGAAPAPDRTG